MKKKSLMRLLSMGTSTILSACLTSCGTPYACWVSAFGSTPSELTYYIEPIDSNLIDDLEFQEYAASLKNRLNESGYKDVPSNDAALCIRLAYYMGSKELAGTSTSSHGFSIINGKITANTIANASGNATTNVLGNKATTTANANGASSTKVNTKQQTNTYNFSSTDNIYRQDVGCYIEALDVRNRKIVWTVETRDYIKSYQSDLSLRKLMPWMLAAAQTYFGKSGEKKVWINEKEGVKQKGLPKL